MVAVVLGTPGVTVKGSPPFIPPPAFARKSSIPAMFLSGDDGMLEAAIWTAEVDMGMGRPRKDRLGDPRPRFRGFSGSTAEDKEGKPLLLLWWVLEGHR